jgi:hypothetical protein
MEMSSLSKSWRRNKLRIMREMRSVGLDWAVQSKNRAAVCVERSHDGAIAVTSVTTPVSDEDAASLCTSPENDVVAVDIPFAWPRTFADFVGSWTPQNVRGTTTPDSLPFRFRTTDHFVYQETRKRPLSISSNLFALGARRWAEVVCMANLGPRIVVTRDDGASLKPAVIEVYPGATLRVFENLLELAVFSRSTQVIERGDEGVEDEFSYKSDPQTRRGLIRSLAKALQLELDERTEESLVSTGKKDHAADALLAAITGLIFLGALADWTVVNPTDGQIEDAQREGWIFFPKRRSPHANPSAT